MKSFVLLLLAVTLIFSCTNAPQTSRAKAVADDPVIGVNVYRISDIRFPDQQYSIYFRLHIDYLDSTYGYPNIDFAHQLTIPAAKKKPEVNVAYVNREKGAAEWNLALDVHCTMDKAWDVSGYPFDDQALSIELYMTGFDSSRLKFHLDDSRIQFLYDAEFDGNWVPNLAQTTKDIRYSLLDADTDKKNSVFNFTIPIHRENPYFIFWKLFAGMYFAFLVSFVALYVRIDHIEPRFGLPVGGLFATVANKYIIEGLLPLTSRFTLVDCLHDITIFFIFLIIAFSAVSLKHADKMEMPGEMAELAAHTKKHNSVKRFKKYLTKRVSEIKPVNFLIFYVILNVIAVLIARFH